MHTMERTINRNLLQYAAGHQIFCSKCGTVLDMKTTVHVDLAGKAIICCAPCFDLGRAKVYSYALSIGKPVEVVDGRDLWPPTLAQAKRICKALGVTIRYNADTEEYDCNLRGGKEATRYYTPDINDAIGTARMMAAHVAAKGVK